jgi:hypothetical protein
MRAPSGRRRLFSHGGSHRIRGARPYSIGMKVKASAATFKALGVAGVIADFRNKMGTGSPIQDRPLVSLSLEANVDDVSSL